MQHFKKLQMKEISDQDGDTALHYAAAAGKTNLVLSYLSLGNNVNRKNSMSWSPLMLAARNGHSDCVKLLLEFGADILARSRYGICALPLAVASGDLVTVKCLLNEVLQKRINIKEVETPISPIIFAILLDHVEICKYLLKKGFTLDAKSAIGDIPIETICGIVNNKEIMEYLEEFRALNDNTKHNSTYLSVPNNSFCNSSFSPISSPLLNSNLSFVNTKRRKYSNLSESLLPNTPDISPIMSSNSPTFFSSIAASPVPSSSPKNDYLNKRFSLPTKDTLVVNKYEETSKSIPKHRSYSYNIQPVVEQAIQNNELEDDVFENDPSRVDTSLKNREFIEMLRRNSLDSCVELFQKNEIDMDVFLTLSKGDLDEIGINWDKRADILELIYLLNK